MAEVKVQQYKVDAVAELKESFEGSRSFIFADYRGLSVGQITELRTALREAGAEFHVVKNNYAKIAFKQMDHEGVAPYLVGPTAIAYCGDEAGPVAKAMLKLAKDMPLEVKGGLLDGDIYDEKAVEAFSKLPTKLELIQMLMGTMKAPANNVVYVLNAVTTKLVRTLDAVREQKASE
ncbi:MAG: 50S ribosomal protein L10 [Spirochaetales bacterium]|nr:50S ribosomal protein L10 [Spirochaetales bacterium]